MPEIIETNVYRLDELSDAAKHKARAWYREGGFDYDWYDAVYEDFQRIAEILGIRLKTRTVRLMGGGSRQEPCIWFRGFWSQCMVRLRFARRNDSPDRPCFSVSGLSVGEVARATMGAAGMRSLQDDQIL